MTGVYREGGHPNHAVLQSISWFTSDKKNTYRLLRDDRHSLQLADEENNVLLEQAWGGCKELADTL